MADVLKRSAFDNLEASIELALSQTEGFRDEAENFADLARRGIRLVPPGVVADLSSFPSNPEGGDAVLVESEDQIYFFDSDSSTWKDSKIIGSAIFANIQGDPSDNTALQTALDGKADSFTPTTFNVEYDTEGDPFDSISYLNNEGVYTISNGFVMGQINIATSSLTRGSASGNVIITGFPEPINGFASVINIGAESLGFSGDYPLGGHVRNIGGSIVIRLRTYSSNSVGASNLQASNMSESTNRNQFICSFVYKLG